MSDTQTVIVYRNRAEHDFYESGMMIPLIAALVVGAVSFVLMYKVGERFVNSYRRGSDRLFVGAAVVACFAAGFVFHKMML